VIPTDPRLLVGFEWADDAGVVKLDLERGLVQTVDFFTPIVDDPFTYGAIAATNALSDVWAMGGEPLCAMNLVGFPDKDLPAWVLTEILQGGLSKLQEAGTMLVGGHSVRDPEIKYGLSVTGLVHPDRIWRNGGALPGDALVLTKPIGTGILTTARKRDAIEESDLDQAKSHMFRLNRDAKRAAERGTVHACTDITGNGLCGHAWEMARASSAILEFWFQAIPRLHRALELAGAGFCPGGTSANRRYVGANLALDGLSESQQGLVLDPQTSGGLLFAVPADEVPDLLQRMHALDVPAVVVGTVRDGPATVVVKP
jgi:selenide,water dikinase